MKWPIPVTTCLLSLALLLAASPGGEDNPPAANDQPGRPEPADAAVNGAPGWIFGEIVDLPINVVVVRTQDVRGNEPPGPERRVHRMRFTMYYVPDGDQLRPMGPGRELQVGQTVFVLHDGQSRAQAIIIARPARQAAE